MPSFYARVIRAQKPRRLQGSTRCMTERAGRYARFAAFRRQPRPHEIYRRALAAMGHVVTAKEAEALFLDDVRRA